MQAEVFSRDRDISDGDPIVAVVDGPSQKILRSVPKSSNTRIWPPRVRFYYTVGDREAKHDENFPYRIPFERGKSVPVAQGFFGKSTHKGDRAYAIDFLVPEGTEVHAARDGVVVEVVQHFNEGGTDPSFGPKANFIKVQHSDRTVGAYLHLRENGVLVHLGQKIQEGDLIGYSGNTGLSYAPHLHFEVMRPKNGIDVISMPFQFQLGETAKLVELREGVSYQR